MLARSEGLVILVGNGHNYNNTVKWKKLINHVNKSINLDDWNMIMLGIENNSFEFNVTLFVVVMKTSAGYPGIEK